MTFEKLLPKFLRNRTPSSNLISVAIATLTFVIYFVTLRPGISGGDSGELVTVAATLGVAHPPGYPTYTMLGHLFSLLPVFGHGTDGNIAMRLGLFSATCSAIAAGLFSKLVYLRTRSKWISFVSAVSVFLSESLWSQSVVAEVFALHVLFVVLVLFYFLKILEKNDSRGNPSEHHLYAFSFLCGLSCTHHVSIVFLVVPCWAYLIRQQFIANVGRIKHFHSVLLISILFGLVGLLPYLYLVYGSLASSSLLKWGDQSTFNGFLVHVLRQEYGTFRLGNSEGSIAFQQGSNFFPVFMHFIRTTLVGTMFLPVFALLLRFGIRRPRKPIQTFEKIVGISLLTYLLFFLKGSNLTFSEAIHGSVQARFWIVPSLWLVLFLAPFFADTFRFLQNENSPDKSLRKQRTKARTVTSVFTKRLYTLTWLSWSFLFPILFGLNVKTFHDRKTNYLEAEMTKAIRDLPNRTIWITSGDHISGSAFYLMFVKNIRPDVCIIDQNLLTYFWYTKALSSRCPSVKLPPKGIYGQNGFSLKEFLELNLEASNTGSPIVVTNGLNPWEVSYQSDYELYSWGLGERFFRKSERPKFEEWTGRQRKFRHDFNLVSNSSETKDRLVHGDWDFELYKLLFRLNEVFASRALVVGLEKTPASGGVVNTVLIDEARVVLEDLFSMTDLAPALSLNTKADLSLSIEPLIALEVLDSGALKNLGLAYQQLGSSNANFSERMKAAWGLYLKFGPQTDPERAVITQIIKK